MTKKKVLRIVTTDLSLTFMRGQLKRLSDYFDVIAVSGFGEKALKFSNEEGVPVKFIDMERRINPIKDLLSLIRMYRLIKKEKPDIVHTMTPKAGLIGILAAYFARTPVRIHTFTGLIFPSKKGLYKKLLIFIDKIICQFATKVIPEGQGVRKDLLEYGITYKDLRVLANGNVNGIDPNYFSPYKGNSNKSSEFRQSYGINENDFVFTFVGRIVKDKGIYELVSSFVCVNRNYPNTKLLLVGPFEDDVAPLNSNIKTLIEEHPNIIFLGWQKDIRPFLSITDVFTFPSYREGFPNAVMQAGAMGLGSIVTDINGSNEIIIPNSNGIIIPSRDKDALQKAMLRCLNKEIYFDPVLCRQMIIDRFHQDLVWNEVIDLYRNSFSKSLSYV